MKKKTIGVIGGMGPIATSHYMELVIRMTKASVDQDHLDMLIYNMPSIPDRTEYILDAAKPSPLPQILEIAARLESQGADLLCMPCVTAHCFYEEMKAQLRRPMLHMVEETAKYLAQEGISSAGIMATDGTIAAALFQQAFAKYGIQAVLPTKERQADVMHIIYQNVKADQPADMRLFSGVEQELKGAGAKAIVLGCTELSLVKRDETIGHGFLDAMEVLALQSILHCGGTVKEGYLHLLS